jgi:hypothetical protein
MPTPLTISFHAFITQSSPCSAQIGTPGNMYSVKKVLSGDICFSLVSHRQTLQQFWCSSLACCNSPLTLAIFTLPPFISGIPGIFLHSDSWILSWIFSILTYLYTSVISLIGWLAHTREEEEEEDIYTRGCVPTHLQLFALHVSAKISCIYAGDASTQHLNINRTTTVEWSYCRKHLDSFCGVWKFRICGPICVVKEKPSSILIYVQDQK